MQHARRPQQMMLQQLQVVLCSSFPYVRSLLLLQKGKHSKRAYENASRRQLYSDLGESQDTTAQV
jgi:hypothetical protein